MAFERKTYTVEAAGGRVQVQLRTASELAALDKKHRSGDAVDLVAYNRECFVASVTGWEGGLFEGHPLTDDEKASLYEVHTDLANEVIARAVVARRDDREAARGN